MPTAFETQAALEVKELMALKTLRGRETRLGMKLFPQDTTKEPFVIYERWGIMRGMQQARGLGGPTRPVQLPGFTSFKVSPGYYGEHVRFDEKKLLYTRAPGEWMKSQSYKDLIAYATTYLAERYENRYEYNVFEILQEGGFWATDDNGTVYWQVMYDIPKLAPAILWNVPATSIPLQNLRSWMVSLRLGKSVDFRGGTMIMNSNTLNMMLANTNAADLGGRRLEFGNTINSAKDQGKIFLANDLPEIIIYDEDYYPETGGAVRFVRDGKIIFSGKRLDGQKGGRYVQTPAVQNGNRPGEWVIVFDGTQTDSPYYKVAHGHNAVPVLEYPEAWAVATVY